MIAASPLTRALSIVRRRQRWADLLWALSRWCLPVTAALAAVSVFAIRWGLAGVTILSVCLIPLGVACGWAWLRPLSERTLLRRVDHHFDLNDQLGTAFELEQTDASASDPKTKTIIALLRTRADALVADVDARQAVHVIFPRPHLWVTTSAVLMLVAAGLIPPPRAHAMVSWIVVPSFEGVEFSAEQASFDLSLAEPLRKDLQELEGEDTAATVAAQILDVLAQLETGDLDRAFALERLETLEQQLLAAQMEFEAEHDEDTTMLADAMLRLADTLQQHDITDEAGKALIQHDSDASASALESMADAASNDPQIDRQMQAAMRDASQSLARSASAASETDNALEDAERRLRRNQDQRDDESDEDYERRLRRHQDRVEQLRRQHEREAAARRRLEQLRRDAQQAASGSRQATQQRQRAAERMARGTQSAADQARTAQRLQRAQAGLDQAKTIVRRAGDESDSNRRRREQTQTFIKTARGNRSAKSNGPTMLIEGDVDPSEADAMFVDEDGNPIPGNGDGQESTAEGDGSNSSGQADLGAAPGEGMGEGSVEPLANSTRLRVSPKNVRVDAQPGRGVSRAEVIRQSSQEGFATEAYRDVFVDYRAFAQSALDHESVPANQRRTIQRYYQLIQPQN